MSLIDLDERRHMHRSLTMLKFAAAALLGMLLGSDVARGEFLLSAVSNSPAVVSPGDQVSFAVVVTGLDALPPGQSIFSFALNIGASSAGLTGTGTDFSQFAFDLNPALAGGLPFDDNIADDGHVEYEIGFAPSGPDLTLGQLSVVAPNAAGLYSVAFQIDPLDPFGAGTFLLIDDGSPLGLVAPGDLDLLVAGGEFSVASNTAVPEPSSIAMLCGMGVTGIGVLLVRRRRNGR
jgi:hypothetical protein